MDDIIGLLDRAQSRKVSEHPPRQPLELILRSPDELVKPREIARPAPRAAQQSEQFRVHEHTFWRLSRMPREGRLEPRRLWAKMSMRSALLGFSAEGAEQPARCSHPVTASYSMTSQSGREIAGSTGRYARILILGINWKDFCVRRLMALLPAAAWAKMG